MKKITFVWAFLIIILTSFLLYVGIEYNKKTKDYRALENDLVEAAEVYFGQDINLTKLPKNKQTIQIEMKALKDFGIKINNVVNGENCLGYVEVKGQFNSSTYKSYIKCDNYVTKGY